MPNPKDEIQNVLVEAGFPHHGFVRLERPLSIDLYKAWLEKGYAGDMAYLTRHLPAKESPQLLMRRARSAIVVTANYLGLESKFPLKTLKVASYARGEDYHHWLKRRLQPVVDNLKAVFPEEDFVTFTDSAPVLERDLAYRAGLGWIGKNSCLINRERGSFFFIAEIFTTLDLESNHDLTPTRMTNHDLTNHPITLEAVDDMESRSEQSATIAQLHDFCGTCTRCLDVCPTGALVAPRELDARKCISYLTIEAKEIPSEELRKQTDGWFFGCDLCQTICPWNLKVHGTDALKLQDAQDSDQARAELIEELRLILTSSNSRLEKMFAATPLARARGTGLKRNALLVCATRDLYELIPEIERCGKNKKIEKLVIWTLRQLAFIRKEERH